jgi:hypothetical protein
MWKQVFATATVLAIAGSSIVYAQRAGGPGGPDGQGGPGPRGPQAQRYMPTQEDMSAFADARIAAMKAGLRLNGDQEKNWPAFETAYRELAKQRDERMALMRENMRNRGDAPRRQGDVVDFMTRRADAMSKSAAAYKQFAEAAVPLYKSLDDAQKHRFGILTRILRPKPMMFARGRDHGQFEMRGPRRNGPRFGAAEGMDANEFAANPPAEPDLMGLADED